MQKVICLGGLEAGAWKSGNRQTVTLEAEHFLGGCNPRRTQIRWRLNKHEPIEAACASIGSTTGWGATD